MITAASVMPARRCRHLYSRFEFANVCLLYVHTHSHTAVTPDHRAVMCLAVIFLSHYCRLKECLIMLLAHHCCYLHSRPEFADEVCCICMDEVIRQRPDHRSVIQLVAIFLSCYYRLKDGLKCLPSSGVTCKGTPCLLTSSLMHGCAGSYGNVPIIGLL